ncbi:MULTISPECIES: NUDIX hydrolase [unclassified Fusibacter]|uniref:NUDIX hydrolase n=1 Tax=unclassified Fusibacter TaxID=2624464 RepID=UPI0010115F52|nr:NUDIX domain-containing protein [Fusibacter sp. A1]MCK8058158.1 NUDIX domain-containing protein [Fusibacter sp. A2]NPE20741.1 NUDIX domain-containing protein [Fusibacter sp. A1]RXV62948.1 NUDIX domain-containing protein [Fusibacter sp. A1]
MENVESIEEGVLREILEESGVSVKVKELVGIYSNVCSYTARDGVTKVPTKIMMDFICEYEGGELRTSDETSEVKWVPVAEVLDYIVPENLRYRFEKVIEFKGKITYSSYVTKPEYKLLSERFV